MSSEFFMISDNENQPLLKERKAEQPIVTEQKSLADSDEKKRIQSTIGLGRIRPTSSLVDGDKHASAEYPYLVPNITNSTPTKPEKRHSISDGEIINQSTDNNYGSESSDNEEFNHHSVEANSPSSVSSSPGIAAIVVEPTSVPQPAWSKTSPKYHHAPKTSDLNGDTTEKAKQVPEESVAPSGNANKQELSQMVPDLISLCDDILASTEVIVSTMAYDTTVISSGKQGIKLNPQFSERKLPPLIFMNSFVFNFNI